MLGGGSVAFWASLSWWGVLVGISVLFVVSGCQALGLSYGPNIHTGNVGNGQQKAKKWQRCKIVRQSQAKRVLSVAFSLHGDIDC